MCSPADTAVASISMLAEWGQYSMALAQHLTSQKKYDLDYLVDDLSHVWNSIIRGLLFLLKTIRSITTRASLRETI